MQSESAPGRWWKITAVVSAVGLYLVNLVGFLDTITASALGCGPDWPLCNGKVIPNLNNVHTLIEFAHRSIVGFFAMWATIFMLALWWRYRAWREVRILSLVGIAFIFIQAALGALAVVFVNPPSVLALHLGFGILGMEGPWLLTVFVFQLSRYSRGAPSGLAERAKGVDPATRRALWGIWIYTYLAMYWGSYVAFRGGGEACLTWPFCGFNGLAWMDWVHRGLALGLAVLSTWLLVKLRIWAKGRQDLVRAGWALLVMVVVQILTGANLVWHRLATGPYLLH
ncbi:MAG: COX15/CtaA family protein, partial [Thermaerobacter sp.]|nr:COX15/CtaA family protein [Thermaerobacter sp.]